LAAADAVDPLRNVDLSQLRSNVDVNFADLALRDRAACNGGCGGRGETYATYVEDGIVVTHEGKDPRRCPSCKGETVTLGGLHVDPDYQVCAAVIDLDRHLCGKHKAVPPMWRHSPIWMVLVDPDKEQR